MKKEYNDFHILKAIETDSSVSQRKLSSQMDLNVASVNFALKSLIQKGYITMSGRNSRRIKYYITPEGSRKKTQLAYKSFGRNIDYYKEMRNDIESRIIKASDGTEISVAIYGACELSEITYIVVSKRNWNFLGFFLEDSKITDEKKIDFNVQSLNLLKNYSRCLLLLTDKFDAGVMSDIAAVENVETLNLVDYYIFLTTFP
jgi:DNA-binding MarR family transcriptional regulator